MTQVRFLIEAPGIDNGEVMMYPNETKLQMFARLRTESHTRRLEKNKPIRSDFEILGVIAEYMVGQYFGLTMMDECIGCGPITSDPGYDFILPSGVKIDVKGTDRPNGNLLVSTDAKMTADAYILVIVNKELETGEIVGYASKATVLSAPVKNFGHGKAPDVYFVTRDMLSPIESLKG